MLAKSEGRQAKEYVPFGASASPDSCELLDTELAATGITDSLVRISIGLKDWRDLL